MIHLAKYSLIILFLFSVPALSQKLNSLKIEGNSIFDDEKYFQWTGLTLNQNIFKGIIDSIRSGVARNLISQGYYFFKFENLTESVSNDSSLVDISIKIQEGNPAVINEVNFSGVDSAANPTLIEQFKFLKGEVYNFIEIEKYIEDLLVDFENNGRPFAKVVVNSVLVYQDSLKDENYVDLNLNVVGGKNSSIDKISVLGNTSTKDYVIIRELRLSNGEPYVQKKIEELPRRLNRLRFFEPVALPKYYINSKNEGVLLINVKEKNTNNFDGIIGYIPPGKNETSGYVTGLINITLRNLFGTGRAAALRWNKFNRNSQELDLKYLEPWFLGFPLNINLSLYQRIQDSTYVQRKLEGAFEYLATEDLSGGIMISSETVVPTVRAVPVFTVFNSSYLTTGANLKIDTRDDPYSPTEGLLFINSYSFSKKKINGPSEYLRPNIETSIDIQRFSVSFSIFYEIFSRQVIALGVNGRELKGKSFENSDLYRLGGTNTLRGYREEQFLGSRMFWSNLEYRFLFTRRSYGFVFFDTGYYFRPEEKDKNILKSEDFLYGLGLGLNLETNIGVLRVSYALGQGDTFSDGKIHFGIVNDF